MNGTRSSPLDHLYNSSHNVPQRQSPSQSLGEAGTAVALSLSLVEAATAATAAVWQGGRGGRGGVNGQWRIAWRGSLNWMISGN